MVTQRRLTVDDVLSFKTIADCQISPDGSQVAFVLGDSFRSDGKWPMSALWTVPARGGPMRRLTTGPRSDSLPRWSPDGRLVAFLSDRSKKDQRQVFLLSMDGGEARQLTDVNGEIPSPRGLDALQWSPDGRSIAFLMNDPETEDDAIEFEQNPRFTRLWTVDRETGFVECVSPEGLQIWEFAWHPNRPQIAAVVSDEPYEWAWYANRLVRFELRGQAETLRQTRRQIALPVWSPSGDRIAFISSNWSDRGCVAGDVWIVNADGGRPRNVTENIVASIGWAAWSPEGNELLTIGHERGGTGIHRIPAGDGQRRSLW